MKAVAVLITAAVIIESCSSSVPSTPSSPPCAENGPPIGTPVAVNERGEDPPGRAIFVDARGGIRLLENGEVQIVQTPAPVLSSFARLRGDGRVSALVSGASGGVRLWTQGDGVTPDVAVAIPAAYSAGASYAVWSPSGDAALYAPGFDAPELLLVASTGSISRVSLGAELMHIGIWRSDSEVTILTSPRQNQFPLRSVDIWSWRPPAAPVHMAGPFDLVTYPHWSPDGSTLATIEESAHGRSVHLHVSSNRTVVRDSDLVRGPNCTRGVLQLASVNWAPDGDRLVVLAHGDAEFAFFVGLASQGIAAFATPIGTGCFIPGFTEWVDRFAVIPLYGPTCGQDLNGLSNVLALVDPATGKATRYIPIPRKGLLKLSGHWAATATADDKTTFFSMADPDSRITIPFSRLVDYCCPR